MMRQPLVTICVPTYNHARYIKNSIDSILNQNYPNIQLIISDDCSTDETPNIVKQYKQNFPDKIDLQIHAKNLGAPKNVESIYPLIKGEYVCWFAGDDLFLPNKIATQVQIMQDNPDCIFSFHAVNVTDDEGSLLYEYNDLIFGSKIYTKRVAENLLRHRCYICSNSIMINRSLARQIKHNFKVGVCADWLMLFELAACGKVIYVPNVLGTYRRHQNNISKQVDVNSEERVFEYVINNYPEYKKDIIIGLLQLHSTYFFKYALTKNFQMSYYCLQQVSLGLILRPWNIIVVLNRIFSELFKRSCLFLRTGNVFR